MSKKLSTENDEANKLVQEISRKLGLKPEVSLERIKDIRVLKEVSEETKKWGVFLIMSRLEENFVPIFILDSFFRNRNFWKRLLAHECGHIKTFYNGLPYFYLREIEEDPSSILNSVPIELGMFADQFSRYEDLKKTYGFVQEMLFGDLRIRIHDNLANREAINVGFDEDYASFAESELGRFLDLNFLNQPYHSKLVIMDLSEKLAILGVSDNLNCRKVLKRFNEFFKRLETYGLQQFVGGCVDFFNELEFTISKEQMGEFFKTGLSILTRNISPSELRDSFELGINRLLLKSKETKP